MRRSLFSFDRPTNVFYSFKPCCLLSIKWINNQNRAVWVIFLFICPETEHATTFFSYRIKAKEKRHRGQKKILFFTYHSLINNQCFIYKKVKKPFLITQDLPIYNIVSTKGKDNATSARNFWYNIPTTFYRLLLAQSMNGFYRKKSIPLFL
jgi:hypothetical protein